MTKVRQSKSFVDNNHVKTYILSKSKFVSKRSVYGSKSFVYNKYVNINISPKFNNLYLMGIYGSKSFVEEQANLNFY